MPLETPNLSLAPGNDADEVKPEPTRKAIVDVNPRRSVSG